jgi:hypothetical protein
LISENFSKIWEKIKVSFKSDTNNGYMKTNIHLRLYLTQFFLARKTFTRWRYGACALHGVYLRPQTQAQRYVILNAFAPQQWFARTQCYVIRTLPVMLLQSGCTFFSRLELHIRRDKMPCGMPANAIRLTLHNPVVTLRTTRFDIKEFYAMVTDAFTVCVLCVSQNKQH